RRAVRRGEGGHRRLDAARGRVAGRSSLHRLRGPERRSGMGGCAPMRSAGMTSPRFLFVLSRGGAPQDLSAAALGTATGHMVAWVGALWRWRLLDAIAADPASDTGPVRGCLVVSATDLSAAQR